MRTGKRSGPVSRLAATALALVAGVGSGPLVAPAPVRADTVRSLKWYLDPLEITQAHKITKGRGVTVAVIDAGVEPHLPELRGQVLTGRGFGSDATADGRGTDDDIAHGSSMAGVIASRSGGGASRHLGIAPEAKILPVSLGATGDSRQIAEGIRWAVDAGAGVVNMSLGSSRPTTAEEEAAVRYALDKNVVLVASAGNRSANDQGVIAPARIPGVIAVTAVGKNGRIFSDSVTGPEAALAAPGEGIISPVPTSVSANGYVVGNGTSDSAAIVSGVAALVRAKYPDLDAANVVNRLIRTAQDRGPDGRDSEYGFGTVDPVAALTRSVPAVSTNPLLAGAVAEDEEAGETDGQPLPLPQRSKDDGPMVSFHVKNTTGAVIQGALCLLVPIVALVLVIVLVRRSRRPAVPRMPLAGPGFPPPGHPAPPPGMPGSAGPHPPGVPGSYGSPGSYAPPGPVPATSPGAYAPPGPTPQNAHWPHPGTTSPPPPPSGSVTHHP